MAKIYEWRRDDHNKKQVVQLSSSSHRRTLVEAFKKGDDDDDGSVPTPELVNLAAVAIGLNVRLGSADMPLHMQERALRFTRSLLVDAFTAKRPNPNPTHLARSLKKEFDSLYGPAWHCVVGKSFGSFVTHTPGGFVYFTLEDPLSLSFLLFKTEVQLVAQVQPFTTTSFDA